jgi:cardiolipin synthase
VKRTKTPRQPHSRKKTAAHVIPIAILSVLVGYALAVTLAKTSAPPEPIYQLPHDFRVTDATFLPSALPSSTLTPGNKIDILENGVGIFPAMLDAIASAKTTVDFEAYIFWSGDVATRFRDAFVERATHGVQVRVLLDAVGTPGRKLKNADVDAMKAAGVRIEFFHSKKPWKIWALNHRTHRRVLVVDGRIGFTGGVGFADEWAGNADSPEHWRDTQVRVEGPAVRGLQRAFQENWSEVTREALVGDEFYPALTAEGTALAGVVATSPLSAMSGARRIYAISMAAAAKEIWIANSYFLPDDEASALMVQAVKRGVDVRVIVPSDQHNDVPATKAAGRTGFEPLLAGGVKIFEYEPTMFHLKTMMVDGIFSTVGSANFDDRSFQLNEEVNLIVYDKTFAAQMRESYERDLQKCKPYTLEMFHSRLITKRFGEWLAKPFRSEL